MALADRQKCLPTMSFMSFVSVCLEFNMKLSDLSLREYIAIECLPAAVQRYGDANTAADAAFHYADSFVSAFESCREKTQHEIDTLRLRMERAEASYSLLVNHMTSKDASAWIALSQIWEFLGVKNQTAAMQMLRDAFPELCHDRA